MRFFNQELLEQFKNFMEKPALNIYSYDFLESENKLGRLPSSMKQCCGTNIGSDYLNSQTRALKFNKDVFDLALVTYDSHTKFNSVGLTKNILGFMIVQKGECTKFNEAYCVNLICTPTTDNRAKGIGSILMSLYIYCILNNDSVTDKTGLLELANSYINVGGLCLYSKYGFEYDVTLYGNDCFRDYNNLPMILDLSKKYDIQNRNNSNKILKDITLGTNKGFSKPNICNVRGNDKQMFLGILMNLQNFIQTNKTDYIISYVKSDGTIIDYELLYNSFGKNKTSIDTKINNLIQNQSPDLDINDMNTFKSIYIEKKANEIITTNQPTMMTTRKRNLSMGGYRKRYKKSRKNKKKT